MAATVTVLYDHFPPAVCAHCHIRRATFIFAAVADPTAPVHLCVRGHQHQWNT